MHIIQLDKFQALILLLLLLISGSSWAQANVADCNPEFVSYEGDKIIIRVFPTGLDDTENINCALHAAAKFKAFSVLLETGDYYASTITVENFKGSFEGRGFGQTLLHIIDQSVDCAAMVDAGLTPAAIKFVRGEPSLRFMTVSANSPCVTARSMEVLVHFTGSKVNQICATTNSFGHVNRVKFLGPGRELGVRTAVAASSETEFLGGCNVLVGTFKLNRSMISNFSIGVLTAMKSGAEVDVNFNKFSQNSIAVLVANSNQSATLRSNQFDIDEVASEAWYAAAVTLVSSAEDAPRVTRLVVYNNEFNISAQGSNPIDGVSIFNAQAQNVSLTVTNNTFNLDGGNIVGLWSEDVNNAVVSNNTFNGFGLSGLSVINANLPIITGWLITANKNFEAFDTNFVDIEFDAGVTQAYVGPDQNASISDLGEDNIILSGKSSETVQNSLAEYKSEPALIRARGISERRAKFTKLYHSN